MAFTIVPLLLSSFSLTSLENYQNSKQPIRAHTTGIWRVSEELTASHKGNKIDKLVNVIPPEPFGYDGRAITIRLMPMKSWERNPQSDCYRVKAKWEGSDLYWFPPYGEAWCKLATFVDGRFESRSSSGRVWVYERVLETQLKEREKWLRGYNTQKTPPPKE